MARIAFVAVYAVFCVSIVIAAGILGAKLAGAHHTGVECGPGGPDRLPTVDAPESLH